MKGLCVAVVVTGMLLLTSTPQAQEPTVARPYATEYTGSFLSLGAALGYARVGQPGAPDSWAPVYGGWLQATAPLQILDARLAVHRSSFDAPKGSGARAQTSVAAVTGMHPLFLLHLENRPLYYALAGLYVLVGVDAEWVQADERGDLALGYQLGGGGDVPLDDVEDGASWWLGAEYRYNEATVGGSTLFDQHMLFLRVAYRSNGLLVAFDT